MSRPPLVEEFLRDECTAETRRLICDAVANRLPVRALDDFELNRFNLTIDYESHTATIDDELTNDPSGRVVISLTQLMDALQCGQDRAAGHTSTERAKPG